MPAQDLRSVIARTDQSFFKYELNGHMRFAVETAEGKDHAVLVVSDAFLKACGLDSSVEDISESLLRRENTIICLTWEPKNFRYIAWSEIQLIKTNTSSPTEHCYRIVDNNDHEANEDFFKRVAEIGVQEALIKNVYQTLKKNNKNLAPFFHACVEMEKLVYKLPYDSANPQHRIDYKERFALFADYQQTMRGIARRYELILTMTNNPYDKTHNLKYFDDQLALLHKYSKSRAVTKNAKIAAAVLLAVGLLTIAALLIVSVVAAPITLPLLATLGTVGLVSLFSGSAVFLAPQHFGSASRAMHKHYTFFKAKSKALHAAETDTQPTLVHA